MAKGSKDGKPWSFGLFGGKGGKKSVIVLVIVIVLAIFTHIAGAVYNEIQDRRTRPVLALEKILRDVRDYTNTQKKMPADFSQIEEKIWHKTTPGAPSLLHGNKILVADNYEYIYHYGQVQGINFVNVWAIPLGKYREEYKTVLLIIGDGTEEVWRGPALNDEQRNFVLSNGFNPSFAKMSQLNMKKDSVPAQPGKKKSNPF